MFFSEYKGRCIGRLMHFLYHYHTMFDSCQMGDGKVAYYGDLVATYTWDGDTDIPTFVFYDIPFWKMSWLNDKQEQLKAEVIEWDKQ
ncbi:MAG: hypothetical protein WC390_10050 [Sulfurimonas sp.]|jgi:hypothetical protein